MLSRCHTKDAIDSISLACNTNKMHGKVLLLSILPKNLSPSFCGRLASESAILEEAAQIILSADSKDDLYVLTDMCHLNSREEVNLHNSFYACAIHVLELNNGGGAHHCRHGGPDEYTTVDVSFCPGILSTSQLRDMTRQQLEKEGMTENVDYKVMMKIHGY